MDIETVIGYYLNVKKIENRASERDRYSLAHLRPYFAGRKVSDIRRADVRTYIDGRLSSGVKKSTVQRELRLMCAAINFARLEYEIDIPNPAARLNLSADEPRVRWITRAEAARLVQAAEQSARPHLAVFIRLALNTGCRRGELLGLEWSRVDVARRQILLEARHTKTRKRRTVPLNDDAIGALDRMRRWQAEHLPGTLWVFGWRDGTRPMWGFRRGWDAALKRAASRISACMTCAIRSHRGWSCRENRFTWSKTYLGMPALRKPSVMHTWRPAKQPPQCSGYCPSDSPNWWAVLGSNQ